MKCKIRLCSASWAEAGSWGCSWGLAELGKNKDYILMYNGLGAKIDNISTNEVVYPINHFYAL